ncbi:MAG: prolyl oligopeptidase family serine peptidase [Myxococcota bacterium]
MQGMQRMAVALGVLLVACGDDAGMDAGDDLATDGEGGAESSAAGSTGAPDPTTGADADGSGPTTAADDGGDSTGDAPATEASVQLHNVSMDLVDPRWEVLPASLSTVQLPPRYTLAASVPEEAQSVRLSVDGAAEVVDVERPFRWSEDDAGGAVPLTLGVGAHTLQVEAYASADGSGTPLVGAEVPFELTQDGTTDAPGSHAQFELWRNAAGVYLHRDEAGNFVDAEGTQVYAAGQISLQTEGDDQGHLLIDGSDDELVFAFIVLLPDGFDPAVPYPLVVFLHHGWEVYRGTDNDGRPLQTPLFEGPRSIISGTSASEHPSIVLVPQMRRVQSIDGVTHEWAAFSSIADGTSNSAELMSVNAVPVLEVVDLLEAGGLVVDGQTPLIDPHRIYLAGHSMGGLGSWDLLARRPDRFAAGVPMAGYADHARAEAVVDTPIWAFHHELDCYNPASGTQAMFDLITAAGGTRIRYTLQTFDTGGACDQAHFQTPGGAWNDEAGLFEWIFGQVNDRR